MQTRHWFATLTVLALAVPAWADVTSGPAVGDKVPALKVFDATGTHKDKDVDYAAERKDKPTLYVFIHQFSRPSARFLGTLDKAAKNFEDFYIVAVWLTDESDKTKEYLPRVQQSINLEATAMTVFGEKKGPEGWGLNDMAHVTAVVADKGKITATFGLVSVNETDAKPVQEAVEKVAKKKQ